MCTHDTEEMRDKVFKKEKKSFKCLDQQYPTNIVPKYYYNQCDSSVEAINRNIDKDKDLGKYKP